jgi:hypothetical protein
MLVLPLAGLGCAPAQKTAGGVYTEAPIHREWTALDRAEAALGRLRPSYQGPIFIRLSDCRDPAAYSWSDGTICLTQGLLCLLNDDEISAVIAHELGHLTHVEGGCMGFALGGPRTADEQEADAVGIMLLRTSGIPPGSLAHALAKVRDVPQTPAVLRRALTARIALLPS